MLPDMLLPDQVPYEAIFNSFIQIDNRDLTALTLFAGSAGANYSDQLADSFTFSRDGVTIEIAARTSSIAAEFRRAAW